MVGYEKVVIKMVKHFVSFKCWLQKYFNTISIHKKIIFPLEINSKKNILILKFTYIVFFYRIEIMLYVSIEVCILYINI